MAGTHRGVNDTAEFTAAQDFAIKAARELLYGKDVIDKLYSAQTTSEINFIMRSARLRDRR